ncbi:MAG: hypothetical protein IPI67_31265 [Myxococcales bacterium]|nr:hypothetical protein [Myxococcales bacterium]
MTKLALALVTSGLCLLSACSASDSSSGGPGGVGGTGGPDGSAATGGGGTTGGTAGTGGSAGATGGSGGSAGATGGSGGSAGAPECTSAAECPGNDTTCSQRTCNAGSCGKNDAAQGTTCTETGGAVCDGAGACVACVVGTDCTDGVCVSNKCVPATCTDSVKNGTEADIDCGGSCPPCKNAQSCGGAADCESGFCKSGSDGGGSDAGAGDASIEAGPSDAGAGPGTCAACTSSADCIGSAGTYCDAGKCVPKKTGGAACGAAGECLSGYCPADDGVCCDTACDSPCQACKLAKTTVANGTCAPVTKDTDPDTECATTAAATCGVNGTGCNGNSTTPACNVYPSGTVCGAAVCTAGSATAASTCTGTGTCNTPPATSCSPYLCKPTGDACGTSCAADVDCAATAYCSGSTCKPKQANGQVCGGANQCTSGNCVDGVCCNSPCGGACDSCAVSGNVGSCSVVPAGQPGSPSCAPYYCSGTSSSCPGTCGTDTDCISGTCVGGACLVKCLAQNDDTSLGSYVDNSNVFALMFTPASPLKVRRLEIYTGNGPGTGQTTLGLRADAAGLPGAFLASGAFTVSAAVGWQGVNLPLTVLASGTQYWLYYDGANGTWFPIGSGTPQNYYYSSSGGASWSGPNPGLYAWKYRLWCEP